MQLLLTEASSGLSGRKLHLHLLSKEYFFGFLGSTPYTPYCNSKGNMNYNGIYTHNFQEENIAKKWVI